MEIVWIYIYLINFFLLFKLKKLFYNGGKFFVEIKITLKKYNKLIYWSIINKVNKPILRSMPQFFSL